MQAIIQNPALQPLRGPLVSCFRFAWRLRLGLARRLRWKLSGAQVLVVHERRVLMIRNSYRDGLFLPGGNSPPAEPAVETAARELGEEVGLRVGIFSLTPLARCRYDLSGAEVEDAIFLAQPGSLDGLSCSSLEVDEVLLMDREQLRRHRGDIQQHVYELLCRYLDQPG